MGWDGESSRRDLGQVATNIFRKIRKKRLDSPVDKPPDGQITGVPCGRRLLMRGSIQVPPSCSAQNKMTPRATSAVTLFSKRKRLAEFRAASRPHCRFARCQHCLPASCRQHARSRQARSIPPLPGRCLRQHSVRPALSEYCACAGTPALVHRRHWCCCHIFSPIKQGTRGSLWTTGTSRRSVV